MRNEEGKKSKSCTVQRKRENGYALWVRLALFQKHKIKKRWDNFEKRIWLLLKFVQEY